MSAESIRDRVAAAKDLTEEMSGPVTEWDDVEFLLISPTVTERTAMTEQFTIWTEDVDGNLVGTVNREAMAPSLVIACCHDPETKARAFEEKDIDMLRGKNGAVVDRLARKCFPLVGFSAEGATEAGKGDSSTTPSADTSSGSPGVSGDPPRN